MNTVYEDAFARIDADALPVPSALGILRAVRNRMSAARQRRVDGAMARSLADIGHPGVLADYHAARDPR
jgi:hypothetical protein